MTRMLRNVFSNWTGMAVSMAVAFFLSPFLVHTLGDHDYGLWVLILSLTGYMSLLDVGLRVSVVKYVSQHSTLKEFDRMNAVIGTAFMFYSAAAVVVLCVTVAIAQFFPRVFTIDASDVTTAKYVVLLAGANVALSLVGSIPAGILAGLQRYDVSAAIGITGVLIRTAVIVALLRAGFGIVALASVHLGMQVFFASVSWAFARRTCPELRLAAGSASFATLREMWSYSVFVLVNNFGRFLLFGSGEIVIGSAVGAASVTYYAIAGTIAQYMQQIVVTMTQVFHPYAAALHARGSTDGLRTTALMSTKLSLLIGVPIAVTAVIAGGTFISLWMGPAYGLVAAPLLVVLTLARLVNLSQSGSYEVLLGMNRHRVPTMLNLAAGVLSVAGAVALVSSYGLTGAVVGGALPIVLIHGVVVPMYVIRVLDIGTKRYLREAVLPPLVAVVPYGAALAIAMRLVAPASLPVLGLIVVGTLPIFAVAAWFSCFNASERARVWASLPIGRLPVAPPTEAARAVDRRSEA